MAKGMVMPSCSYKKGNGSFAKFNKRELRSHCLGKRGGNENEFWI